MAVKYILVGGFARKAPDGGRAFCEECVAGFLEPVKILVCAFAREPERWNETLAKDTLFFKNNIPNVQCNFALATPENFLEQIAWADCIYFRGGQMPLLKKVLSTIPGWQTKLAGKTVVGASVGADLLAAYNYDVDALTTDSGCGLINAKTITHYQSDYHAPLIDWDKALAELKSFGKDLPIITLREGEFVVKVL